MGGKAGMGINFRKEIRIEFSGHRPSGHPRPGLPSVAPVEGAVGLEPRDPVRRSS